MQNNFETVSDFINYSKENRTEQARMLSSYLKTNISCSSKDIWFAYCNETKLWKQNDSGDMKTYIHCVFSSFDKKIKSLISGIKCEKCEYTKKCTCDKKILIDLVDTIDKKSYVDDIRERAFGMLHDSTFENKINNKADYLSIADGKQINLKTLEVSDKVPSDYWTFECPVKYVENTEHADKFFNDIMPNEEEREYLRKCLGYMLTGDTKARCYFIWYGNGSNGKSVVINLMKKILNQYYTLAEKSVFCKTIEKSSGAASPELYALLGKRFIGYSEGETTDDFDLNMTTIKNITGEDDISCRGLFKPQLTFRSIGKLSLLTNFIPKITNSKAEADRTKMIYFEQEFVHDKSKIKPGQKIADPEFVSKLEGEYLNEVFSWIIKGSVEYFKNPSIIMPERFNNRYQQMLLSEDSINMFIKLYCKKTDRKADTVTKKQIHDAYVNFCNETSKRRQKLSNLEARLEHSGIKLREKLLHGLQVYEFLLLSDAPLEYEKEEDNDKVDEYAELKKKFDEQEQIIQRLTRELEELKKHKCNIVVDVKNVSKKEDETEDESEDDETIEEISNILLQSNKKNVKIEKVEKKKTVKKTSFEKTKIKLI